MKNLFFPILLAAAVFALQCFNSCAPSNLDENEEEEVTAPAQPKVNPGTFKFKVSAIKDRWEEGDKIYVHGSYGPNAKVIELKNISADGKTATVDLGEDVTKFFAAPDGLYAAYPADAVIKEDGLMESEVSFSDFLIPLSVAYLSGDTFEFKDASASLSFKVIGDFDKFAIAGKRRPGLRVTSFSVDYSSKNTQISKPKDDGYPFRYGTLDGGQATLWFPAGVTFSGGYSIYFGKGDDWTKVYTASSDFSLKPGETKDLGDISSALNVYEGLDPKMPEIKQMTRYTVKLNELSGLCVSADEESLWAIGDGSELAKLSLEGAVLNKAGLKTTSGYTLDSEGISVNYDTGDLLISGEPNCAYRISSADIDKIFASSTFKEVESLFKVSAASSFGNSGLEGCTYYKDGLVYLGAQTGAYLYCCDIATGEVIWAKHLRNMHPVITEIAGLSYDPLTDWLWVSDSETHKFYALTGDAEQLLGVYAMKTKTNEESICVDHKHGCVWIGDDYGSTSYVYKYDMSGLEDFIITQ